MYLRDQGASTWAHAVSYGGLFDLLGAGSRIDPLSKDCDTHISEVVGLNPLNIRFRTVHAVVYLKVFETLGYQRLLAKN